MIRESEAKILIRHYAKVLAEHPLPKEEMTTLINRMTELLKIKGD